jgi:uncharacterized metal-binding protein YceD (DUF177 family)
MKLNLERVEEEAKEQELGKWAEGAAAASLEGTVQGLEGELFVRRTEDSIFIEGEVNAVVQRSCDRCGADVVCRIGGELDLTYVPAKRGGNANREVHGGDMDVGFYTEGSLDLGDVLREHFALSLPDRLACDLAEVSLAPGAKCQADMIATESKEKPVDPRFSALKGLKLN